MPQRILIVEDEGLIAADLQRRLETFGYPSDIAHSADEALRCARSTAFALVLMDIRLRGETDGIAVAQALRAALGIPVVYLTAHSDQDTVDRAQLTEPSGYLVKPVADGALRSTVQIAIYKHEVELRTRSLARERAVPAHPLSVPLTEREREVVRLVAEGLTAKEIAEMIHLAAKTVEFHKYNAMRKASARSTADLTRFAVRWGIACP